MPWRFLTLLLALVLYVVLREMERKAKCPSCHQRAGRDWRGQAGYCRNCGYPFWS
jgi:hypothetical protein